MKKSLKIIVFLSLALLFVAYGMSQRSNELKAQESQTMTSTENTSSAKAPGFTLKDQDGNDVSLSDFEGKVIILDFWATWCPPCRAEIPGFIELQNEYGSKGLQVIGVSVDQKGWDVVTPFIAEQKINYPIVLLTDHDVYNTYQELLPPNDRGGIPFTFVLDKAGNIVAQHVGYIEKAKFESEIKPLL